MHVNIKVEKGVATITPDEYVFVGTTSITGLEYFSPNPIRMLLQGFRFRVPEGDSGTLVFDIENEARRTAISPIFFRYWWEDEKLVLKEGLGELMHTIHISTPSGYLVEDPQGFQGGGALYVTGKEKIGNRPTYQVRTFDLLRYAERKITTAALKRVGKKI